MTLSQKAQEKIDNVVNAIKGLITEHHNITGSSSKKGHVQAGGVPQEIGTSLSAGTDNGFYARADHIHTTSYNNLKDVPETFPPTDHTHSYNDITGMPDLSNVIVDVELSNDGSQIIFLTKEDSEV